MGSRPVLVTLSRGLSTRSTTGDHFKLVVVGGGTGGIAVAAKYARQLGPKAVAVIEPRDVHYYQPYFTLVGAGIKNLQDSRRQMSSVMPKNSTWIKDKVERFLPSENALLTADNKKISYDFLVVAIGMELNFKAIKGLPGAFETPGVCSNYSYLTVEKTARNLATLESGVAIFTHPLGPIKCGGAPQKIMYLVDAHLRKAQRRDRVQIQFNTALGALFAVKKYADALGDICRHRDIVVNFQHNLVEVNPDKKEAIFETSSGQKKAVQYDFLHVTPPMKGSSILESSGLSDGVSGYLAVDKQSLQHTRYPNIFGIGDCTNAPNSKTAAAVAAQCGIVKANLDAYMNGKPLPTKYDGYSSCPLVTGNGKCIMAEFGYDMQPLETFPLDQGKERRSMYLLKKEVMPLLYWNGLLKGYWNGPATMRKILHFGKSR